jgi:hypothetical protein
MEVGQSPNVGCSAKGKRKTDDGQLGRNVVLKQQEETNDFEMGFNIDQVAQGW